MNEEITNQAGDNTGVISMNCNQNMEIRLDTALERDIDLLIIEEFISNPEFADVLLSPFDLPSGYVVETVIHSKRDSDLGESDIVIVLEKNGSRHAIHIENKIDAQAMPQQHDRYAKRIEKDIANGEYDTASWMLVAPEKYIKANSEAQKYEHRVTYEQLRQCFAHQQGMRAQYKLALIDKAISEQKNGYQLQIDPAVDDFCSKMNAYQEEKYPGLPTGSIAWWPHRKTPLNGVPLVYKPNKGCCDLTFSGMSTAELSRLTYGYLSKNMMVVSTGKSSSVRISVAMLSMKNSFESKISEVDDALAALQELYELAMMLTTVIK